MAGQSDQNTKVLPDWAKDMTPEEQADILADIPDWDDDGDVGVVPARPPTGGGSQH